MRFNIVSLLLAIGLPLCAQIIDVMVAETGIPPVQIWQNSGGAVFTNVSVDIDDTSGKEGRALAAGDLDNDGDLDVFVGYRDADRVWLNDGFGNFTDTNQSLGSTHSVNVKLGDLDGDGDLDAVVATWGGANLIWFNDGTATFTQSEQTLGDEVDTRALDIGDVDGDGDLDLLTINVNDNSDAVIWINDGAGTFEESGNGFSLPTFDVYDLVLGDLDGDGDLDAFLAIINDNPNLVFLNDGNGFFENSPIRLGEMRSAKVALGDLDGDGDLDAMVANHDDHCDGANHVWLNEGDATFVSGVYFGNHPSIWVDLADFDGDGDLDAFFANRGDGHPNRVWLNDGTGTFFDNGQRLGDSQTACAIAASFRNRETTTKRRTLILPAQGDQGWLVLQNRSERPLHTRLGFHASSGNTVSESTLQLSAYETQRIPLSDPGLNHATHLFLPDHLELNAYLAFSSAMGKTGDYAQHIQAPFTANAHDVAFFIDEMKSYSFLLVNPNSTEMNVSLLLGNRQTSQARIIPALGSLLWSTGGKGHGEWQPLIFQGDKPLVVWGTQPQSGNVLAPVPR
jgi:hypothetical protein